MITTKKYELSEIDSRDVCERPDCTASVRFFSLFSSSLDIGEPSSDRTAVQ